jgi:hypothetical protein
MARIPTPAAPEADALAAARAGDEDAFRSIVDAYRGELLFPRFGLPRELAPSAGR